LIGFMLPYVQVSTIKSVIYVYNYCRFLISSLGDQ